MATQPPVAPPFPHKSQPASAASIAAPPSTRGISQPSDDVTTVLLNRWRVPLGRLSRGSGGGRGSSRRRWPGSVACWECVLRRGALPCADLRLGSSIPSSSSQLFGRAGWRHGARILSEGTHVEVAANERQGTGLELLLVEAVVGTHVRRGAAEVA